MNNKKYVIGEKSFTEREFGLLLSVCDNFLDKILLQVAFSYGLRREDIVRIRVDNIDFTNNTLSYLEKKKHDRVRVMPVSPRLKQELLMYISTLPKTALYLFPAQQRSESLHISSKTPYNRLQRLCDRAGIPRRPFHAIRSSCIKILQKRGWSPEASARWIGDSVRTVQAHYSVPSDSELAELVREKGVF